MSLSIHKVQRIRNRRYWQYRHKVNRKMNREAVNVSNFRPGVHYEHRMRPDKGRKYYRPIFNAGNYKQAHKMNYAYDRDNKFLEVYDYYLE